MIGLGRAVGETMIVLMATGNTPIMDWNIFNGMRTLSANIATELPEAAQDSIPLPGPLPGRPYPLLHDIHSEHSGGNSAPASPQTLQRRVNHQPFPSHPSTFHETGLQPSAPPQTPLGKLNIWLASIGLSLGLIMIFGLLGIIVFNGLEAFWPKTIHELTLAPSSKEEQPLVLYAGITKDQTRHVPADPAHPGSTARDVREYQLFTGSKESYGQSYRYVDAHNVTASATPKGLLCLERMEGGNTLVKPLELKLASGETIPAASPEFMEAFRRVLDRETDLRDRVKTIDTRDIGSVNTRLADVRLRSRP